MAPFPIVTMKNFGSKSLISYSHLHTLETRAEDNFDSRSSQQVSLTSGDAPSRITTEIGGPMDTAGANWRNIHGPYTLKHLSFWTYLALGLIVLWISFVTVYACFRCCRGHIIRLDISDGENPQVYEKGSVAASKRNGRLQKRGWKRERTISAASSEIQFLKKHSASVKGSEASSRGERTGNATSQSVNTKHEPILIELPPLQPDLIGASGVENRNDSGKTPFVDLFNIPFDLPKDSGSRSKLWREPKLSPVEGSIIRPKPVVIRAVVH